MFEIIRHGILLEKTILGFENEGVLNPAIMQRGDTLHMFYRAVRKGNYSTIGYAKFEGPSTLVERQTIPILFPQEEYEAQGIEDPRIVEIDDLFYLSYTCYNGQNAYGGLATSDNLIHFDKKGIITPIIKYAEFKHLTECMRCLHQKYSQFNRLMDDVWDKNLIFFPRRINGNICFIHRIKPDIQFVSVKSLSELNRQFWEKYFLNFEDHILLKPFFNFESSYIGGGCPPIETKEGWIMIYHGVKDSIKGYVYSCCVALLALDNPMVVLARLPFPLLSPEKEYEVRGETNNVCFPTGTACFGDVLYIYYGAADERIAYASLKISELLKELSLNKINDEK